MTTRLIPVEKIVIANDKLTKTLFRLETETFNRLLRDAEYSRRIIERRAGRKHLEVFTGYRLGRVDSTIATSPPFDLFDRAVFNACQSARAVGNSVTTVAVIYRMLTGKPAGTKVHVYFKDAIIESVNKMANVTIAVDMSETCRKLKFNSGRPFKIPPTPILPCRISEGIVNGKVTETVIEFTGDSPLMTIAEIKRQVLTVDAKLFKVEGRNTRNTISVKHYVLWRLAETQGDRHHKLKHVITFEDIWNKCRLPEIDRRQAADLRKVVDSVMKALKTSQKIKTYDFVKQGNKFYSVKWTPP